MMSYYNYLLDIDFLKTLDTSYKREIFVRVDVLDENENYLQRIQGLVTQGTINVQAKSAMRRTASLTFVVDEYIGDIDNVDYLLAINKKIALQVGIKNTTNQYEEYDILWFPQGIFVICSLSLTKNLQGFTASVQLKDKMCLLNGEAGGALPAAIELSKVDTIDVNGNQITQQDTIHQIIYELVNHIGLQDRARMLVDFPNQAKFVQKWSPEKKPGINLAFIQNPDNVKEYTIIQTEQKADAKNNVFSQKACCGYIYTDFTWPNKNPLTCKAGQSVSAQLDKILKVVPNYQYFYDLKGNFVFRQIQNYLNTTKATTIINQYQNNSKDINYSIDYNIGQPQYNFNNSNLIMSYQNAPKYENIKNDFIVWGKRKQSKTPIRYHLAIDTKPKAKQPITVLKYWDDKNQMIKYKKPFRFPTKKDFPKQGAAEVFYYAEDEQLTYCWNKKDSKSDPEYLPVRKRIVKKKREQKALKIKNGRRIYYQYKNGPTWQYSSKQGIIAFESTEGDNILQRSREEIELNVIYYYMDSDNNKKCFKYNDFTNTFDSITNDALDISLILSNEDLSSTIIEIENSEPKVYYTFGADGILKKTPSIQDLSDASAELVEIEPEDWRTILYLQGAAASATGIDSNYYYTQLQSEWTNIYDIENKKWRIQQNQSYDTLNWFLDFIDSNAEVSKYSIQAIGRRTKVVEDESVNCVFEPDIPDFIIVKQGDTEAIKNCKNRGQTYAIAPAEIYDEMQGSRGYNSAFYAVRDLLYQHTTMNNQITLQTIPIYYLDVNQIISVEDLQSGINGEYLIQSLSIPLDVNGNMTITATKLLEKI